MDYRDILNSQLKKLLETQARLVPGLASDTADYIACSQAIAQTVQALILTHSEARRPSNLLQSYLKSERSNTNEIQ
jgi:hypothetical protein